MVNNFIFVNNYETKCLIGIYPNEKKQKQTISVSVKLGINRNEKKDLLESTVSYEEIIHKLNKIKDYSHINLVETLAIRLSRHFEKLSNINYIKIEIIKKDILKGQANVGYILEKRIQ